MLAGEVRLAGFHVETQQVGNNFGILRVGGQLALQRGDLAVGFTQTRDALAGLAHRAVVRVALDGAIPYLRHFIPAFLRTQDVAHCDEGFHVVRVQLQRLTVGALRFAPHLAGAVEVAG